MNSLSSTIRGNLGFGRMTEEQAQRLGPFNTPHPVRGTLYQRMALPGVHTFLTPRSKLSYLILIVVDWLINE